MIFFIIIFFLLFNLRKSIKTSLMMIKRNEFILIVKKTQKTFKREEETIYFVLVENRANRPTDVPIDKI